MAMAEISGDGLIVTMGGQRLYWPAVGNGRWIGQEVTGEHTDGWTEVPGTGPVSGAGDVVVTAEMIKAGCRAMSVYSESSVTGGSFQGIADAFNRAIKETMPGQVNTKAKAAVMVGQACQEVGGFTLLSEYLGHRKWYAPYYGRGWIQVTLLDNYHSFGDYAAKWGLITDPDMFVKNPDSLAVLKYAPYTVTWEFSQKIWRTRAEGKAMIEFVDEKEETWRHVSRAINRGNWYADNPAYHENLRVATIRAILAVTPDPKPPTMSGEKVWPLKEGTYSIGAKWGATGSWARYHTGQDFPAATGTPLYAVCDGVVLPPIMTTYTGPYHVAIKNDAGETFSYWHGSKRTVKNGERVVAGQKIGEVGNEGRSFGSHLHFEYFPPGTNYGEIYTNTDPMKWLANAKKWK